MADCGQVPCAAPCDQHAAANSSNGVAQPAANAVSSGSRSSESNGVCPKCKERPAEAHIRKNYSMCYECLENQLVTKIKGGVKSRDGLVYGDKVALAFSGGPSSSLLLHLLQIFRDPNANKFDKHKMAFDLDVIHIKEDADSSSIDVKEIAEKIISTDIGYKNIHLADVFSDGNANEADLEARKGQLTALLDSVDDSTGTADLITCLRVRLLLDTCREHGYTKLFLGHNSGALAVRAVAAAVKGKGYALPSDAHYIDARYGSTGGPVVAYPMKDVMIDESDVLSKRLGLPCSEQSSTINKHDINALSALFVQNVLQHNPGAVSNINSTVSRLVFFPWNEPVEVGGKSGKTLSATQQSDGGSAAVEVLCPLCSAPLADDEICETMTERAGSSPLAGVCDSCLGQIFGLPAVPGSDVLEVLPGRFRNDIEQSAAAWKKVSESAGVEAVGDADELRKHLQQALGKV